MHLRYNTEYPNAYCFNYDYHTFLQLFICLAFVWFCFSMYMIVNKYNDKKMNIERTKHSEFMKKAKYNYDKEYKYVYSHNQTLPRIVQKRMERRTPSRIPVCIAM